MVALLEEARGTPAPRPTTVVDTDVAVADGPAVLEGHLHLPADPISMVVFAHGSGSSRHSPRNQYVASVLNDAGLGTLLLGLLTRHEEQDRSHVFDVVGAADQMVLRLNREAQAQLRCPNRLAVVEGATHLFEEPGTLDRAAALARDWFVDRLGASPRPGVDQTAERR